MKCAMNFLNKSTRHLFFALTLLAIFSTPVKAQQAYIAQASNQDVLNYLSENEKEVLVLLNMVRTNGPAFAQQYLTSLIGFEGDEELIALQEKLKKQSSLPPLSPLLGLQKAAFVHARNLTKSNGISASANNQPFYDRIHQYVPGATKVAESASKGSNDPLLIVVQFLLGDENDGNSGTMNVLDPDLRWVGISIQPDVNQCYSTVMDMAGQPYGQFASNHTYKQGKATNNHADKCPPGMMMKRRTGFGKLMKKIF